MSVFRDIQIGWGDAEYSIPANQVLQCIAQLEEVMTIQELSTRAQNGTMPLSKVAMAYGVILRFAGADVTDDEVFQGLFEKGGTDNLHATFTALFAMITPKSAVGNGVEKAPGKKPNRSARRKASSKSGTRRSAAKAVSRQPNSGS